VQFRSTFDNNEVTSELEELIAALDRRVARVQAAGEAEIARDAAALRAKAIDRLGELASQRSGRIADAEPDSPELIR
jgi:hypothetical protein